MEKIFTDENHSWQFDFSSAIWATSRLHEIYSTIKGSVLSDVDFIVEDEHRLLLIECKNANIKNATYPKSFHPLKTESLRIIARKYYDSLHFIRSLCRGKQKKIIYVYIVEAFHGGTTERKGIRNRLKEMLPFKLQKKYNFPEHMIDDVNVFNLDEWNLDYPKFPAIRLKGKKWDT